MSPTISGYPGHEDDPNFLTGYITGVRRVTMGHSLAASAAVGATVLTLNDVADFIEGEGRSQVMISGQVYDYDEVDPDANTITLADPLTVAGVEDDPVDLFDPEVGGTIVVGYKADIMLDDTDPTGRPITVDVSHALTEMLEESERGAFGENVTVMRVAEHKWAVWQVDGKLAANLIADEAIVAADAAFDQALAALTQAELALAISDGNVNIYYQASAPWANGSTAHDDDTGDVWVETDAVDTAYRWLDRTWTLIGDASIVSALIAAQSAQTTADGKITHFIGGLADFGGSPPVAEGYGDIWTDEDHDNKKLYWDGNSWEPLLAGSAAIATELIGKIVTGGTVRTAGAGVSRMEMTNDGVGGRLSGYNGSTRVGYLDFTGGTARLQGPNVLVFVQLDSAGFSVAGDFSCTDGAEIAGGLDVTSGGAAIVGNSSVIGALAVSGSTNTDDLDVSGQVTGLGKTVNGLDFGNKSGTTDASSNISVSHNCGATPVSVNCTGSGNAGRSYTVISANSSTFTVKVKNAAGSDIASTAVEFYWQAFA